MFFFTGKYKVYGEDNDQDGVYDCLTIEVEVDVVKPGTYAVVGNLSSKRGEFITERSSVDSTIMMSVPIFEKKPGIRTVKVRFRGEDIYRSHIDGPYSVVLWMLREGGEVADSLNVNTPSFKYAQFGERPARMKLLKTYGEDRSGDGLYDYLTVEVDINVLKPMSYRIRGILYSPNASQGGREISSVSLNKYLSSSQVVKLRFSGIEIWMCKVNGPYMLDISLCDENGMQVGLIEEYQTKPYKYTQFQKPTNRFTAEYTDYGIDVNNNGLYDQLAVIVGVEIVEPGRYTIEGWLYNKDGNCLSVAPVPKSLNKGRHKLVLTFSCGGISENRVSGPYYLKYLVLKSEETEKLMDAVEDAYTITGYNLESFE